MPLKPRSLVPPWPRFQNPHRSRRCLWAPIRFAISQLHLVSYRLRGGDYAPLTQYEYSDKQLTHSLRQGNESKKRVVPLSHRVSVPTRNATAIRRDGIRFVVRSSHVDRERSEAAVQEPSTSRHFAAACLEDTVTPRLRNGG